MEAVYDMFVTNKLGLEIEDSLEAVQNKIKCSDGLLLNHKADINEGFSIYSLFIQLSQNQ